MIVVEMFISGYFYIVNQYCIYVQIVYLVIQMLDKYYQIWVIEIVMLIGMYDLIMFGLYWQCVSVDNIVIRKIVY